MFWRALMAATLACALTGTAALAKSPPAPEASVSSTTAEAEVKAVEAKAEAKRLHDEELVRQYEAAERGEEARELGTQKPELEPQPSFATLIFKMILVLGGVLLLAYALLGRLLPRLLRIEPEGRTRRIVRVVDRAPIDPRRSVLVIRVGDRYYLLGASEGGIQLLSKLDEDEIEDALASADARREEPALGGLASLFTKKRS